MRSKPFIPLVLVLLNVATTQLFPAPTLPASDQRAGGFKDLNTPRTFPKIGSKSEWEARARDIRENILVSCGLWPLPDRAPLNARLFGKMDRDGYSIEKVYFQTYPGFYLAGNLYRPLGQGAGPFPAILNPHGHWANGRMADTPDGSIAARCIHFAKQGMIAFSYDMVGYNDTRFPDWPAGEEYYKQHRRFATNAANLLWNISLMGLQTWNSIRALDFLESLPDADKSRLACTGESGGGTQTFILGAVDGRLAAQAPIVMVSHSFQGGCSCENAPGLRLDYSNMEIAAVPVPRPQILVAATGDWTKMTLTIEGPAIADIYRLFKAEDRFHFVRFDYGHNYNQTSREAVYDWFGRWLLKHPDPASLKEAAYAKEPDADLRVWPDGKLPADALGEEEFIRSLIRMDTAQLERLRPRDRVSLEQFKAAMWPAWKHTLQVSIPEGELLAEAGGVSQAGEYTVSRLAIGRSGKGDRIEALMVSPRRDALRNLVVLAHPQGKSAWLDKGGAPLGLAKKILGRGHSVILFDAFLAGEPATALSAGPRKQFDLFASTYNRTDLQERVQDCVTVCAFAQTHSKSRRIILCGAGRAGLWALLAAPAADAVAADGDALDLTGDTALLEADLFVPGIRKIGLFAGATGLAAPHPLLLHNTGKNFPTDLLRDVYAAAGAKKMFRQEEARFSDDGLADWLAR
jgi:dienelactone hydrolase